jgi:hypothetical protein
MTWIHLAEDRDHWQACVKSLTCVPHKIQAISEVTENLVVS